MTATTAGSEFFTVPDTRLRRLLAGPGEGWLTLAAVAAMLVAVCWSIDDSRWVRGDGSLTDFLPLVGLGGVAFGFLGPKLGWGRWTTHLLGIGFAAMLMPVIAGGLVLGDAVQGWDPGAIAARYHESAGVIFNVWLDLAVRGLPRTGQFGHYFIAFGALVWATGQYAAYAVFGHRRALDAVLAAGLVLLTNMAITAANQLHLMVLFTLAALTLLARSHAFDEQVTWVRRRIGDPASVTGLYLRGGAIFITGAVLGSLFLTATASSAPLQGLWTGVPKVLVNLSQALQKFLPHGGNSIDPGFAAFGADSDIIGSWTSNDTVVFRVQLPASETEQFYWKVGTYADLALTSMHWGKTTSTDVAARDPILAGTPDDPAGVPGRREIRFVVTREGLLSDLAVSPDSVEWIDQATTLNVTSPDDYLAAIELDAREYTVTAMVPLGGTDPGEPTKNRLRVASRDYSPAIERHYLSVPDDAIGPEAQRILDTVMALTPDDNPYDIAKTMEAYLKSSDNFRYDTDVTDEMARKCAGLSTAECFATIKAGFCQLYAYTMAVLLREAGIPTRVAQGYLPFPRSGDGVETVRQSGAHAWVEVFFPGYGWIPFDPTGGSHPQLTELQSGPPETATPRPSTVVGTVGPRDPTDPIGRGSGAPVPPGTTEPSGPSSGPFIAIGALLAIAVLALAYAAWKRGPRPMHPDQAWGSLGRWAARFGLGPRASQTVYEYAGVLGDALPLVRPELTTVAHAKVEVAYARRELGEDQLRAVAAAHRRLRFGLIRLLPRRFRRFRRRR